MDVIFERDRVVVSFVNLESGLVEVYLIIKVLGLKWNIIIDNFVFGIDVDVVKLKLKIVYIKREVVFLVVKLFDLIGLIVFFLVRLKLIF